MSGMEPATEATEDWSKLESRADTLALAAYAFPLIVPVAMYYGFRLRKKGSDMADRILGQAFGALVFYGLVLWYVSTF